MNNSPNNENNRQRKLKAHLTMLADDSGLVDASITVWLAIFILLGAITGMWFLNITGLQWINWFIGMAGVIIFAMASLGPNNILASAGLGGVFAFLMDRDKTQGLATGPYWLFRIVNIVSFGFLFSAISLATWPFRFSPIAFWAVFSCVMALMMWEQHTGKKSKWGEIIMVGYLTLTIVVALLTTLGGPFTSISNQPTTWFGWLEQAPAIDGNFKQLLSWWPLAAIVILAVVSGLVPRLRSAAKISIAAVVIIWLVTSGQVDSIMGGSKPFIGQPSSGPCAFENNRLVPENGKLMITLCSQELRYQNIMSVRRDGPRPVKVEFAQETLALHGDMLKNSKPEEFFTLQEEHSLGQDFLFSVRPNNEKFYQHGFDLVPLKFTIEYYKSELTTE